MYIDAVGKPCVRDHISPPVPMTVAVTLPTFNYQATNGTIVLTWSAGSLQSAPTPAGSYSNVANAVNPYTVQPSNIQQFFRVIVP